MASLIPPTSSVQPPAGLTLPSRPATPTAQPASSSSSVHSIPRKEVSHVPERTPAYHRLSAADHDIVLQSVGAVSIDERHALIQPTSFLYPPKGLPDGLYKDIIRDRVFSQYKYVFFSLFYNLSLILQIILGATMTALGSIASGKDTPITVFAAANTVNAGILALMHNSGLPDRYKNDWNEYDLVEMYVKELIESAIVQEGVSRDQAIENCFAMYKKAKLTVAKNKPSTYASSSNPAASESSEHLVGH